MLPVPVHCFHCTHDLVTENVLQAGMEKTLAESLLEISRKTHEDRGIKIYHVPYHPRRIYIEAPGIIEIQEFMKFSAYSHLVSRVTRIFDDTNREFLHGTKIPDVPSPGSWVRIVSAGIYKGDLGLVVSSPREGDVVLITVVPRFDVIRKRKRKARELFARAAPAPALLDAAYLAKFPLQSNIHTIGSRTFHRTGLEVLQVPSALVLKTEPRPTDAELFLFQSCLERLDMTYDTEQLIRHAVNEALRKESSWLWHTGDRVRILEGAFVDTSCCIHEIDEANRTVILDFGSSNVKFGPSIADFGSAMPIRVEVSMEDLEREFLVGDQVCVALGKNKGRTGLILEITDDVATIVEEMANQPIEVTPPPFVFIY
jgi:ribosomal protein L24